MRFKPLYILCIFIIEIYTSLLYSSNQAFASHVLLSNAKAYQVILPSLQKKIASLNMALKAPILIRLYKEEGIMEIWKERRDKNFVYLTSYKICRWSGLLGPKYLYGDLQSPEGFYKITLSQLNPNSHYYLSLNIGYPNQYDRAHRRTGSAVMIHGGCKSVGCYAMQDKNIGQIYALVRDALAAGQKSIQVQALPFKMNDANMARYKKDSNYPFWQNLKKGTDLFEKTHRPPTVHVFAKEYSFQPDLVKGQKLFENGNFYGKLGAYGQKIHDYLHGLRTARKTLHGLEEAQRISAWTRRLVRGEAVSSLEPPYNS